MTRTLVFIGPTLPAAEVRALLPGAVVCAPAGVGDILRVIDVAPRLPLRVARIALVDGYFERMAAVWHKELLLAIERGVAVFGAASMGALRAAELERFGMVGVGAIFKAFRAGTLAADDEVAIAHLPAAQGYRALSDALVNLRFGLAGAKRARVISRPTHDRLVALARARFYRERSWIQLVADGRAARLPRPQLDALERWPKPDAKADDARLLLRLLASARHTRPSKIHVPRTWALRRLTEM